MRALLVVLLGLSVGGCVAPPATTGTPLVPPGVYGVYQDNDIGAINQSAWAFASATNTRGNPIEAARAIVALEYLSGELRDSPRWVGMAASVKLRMGLARDELRTIVGIRPDAPPQLVVNALLQLCWALQTGQRDAAMEALASPVFTQSPANTFQALANLPYVQSANLATARAQAQSSPGGARG